MQNISTFGNAVDWLMESVVHNRIIKRSILNNERLQSYSTNNIYD